MVLDKTIPPNLEMANSHECEGCLFLTWSGAHIHRDASERKVTGVELGGTARPLVVRSFGAVGHQYQSPKE